tara:strand:+ start:88 stop:975 length:888 start_codon:yes stop_codon:yes gene_type:complete
MKYYILILALLLVPFLAFSQKKKDNVALEKFNQGLAYYQSNKLDSALLIWESMVEEEVGIGSDVYGSAFFNIPTIYWQLGDYERAKEWYKKIIDSELNDSDETGSLMEPHTNYKHKSALALAGLYQIDSNYSEVLNWIHKADTLYRYWGFEGSATSISKKQAYLLSWKIQTLLRMSKKDEAIKAIIIELICAGNLEDFFSLEEDEFINLIDVKPFRKSFDKGLADLTITQVGEGQWEASFKVNKSKLTFPIRNKCPEKELPHYWRFHRIENGRTPQKKDIIEYIKERQFYKRLRK